MKDSSKILIGSKAIVQHFPNFYRESKDIDYAIPCGSNYRKDGAEYLVNPILFDYEDSKIISPDNLLSLKLSHLFWDINWEKHIFDTIFLFENGAKINKPFLKDMRQYWEKVKSPVRRSQLEMNKEQFFNNAVNNNTEEHDKIHQLLEDVPAYTKVLKDGCEVELDEGKWNRLSEQEKHDVVFEETAVMAWERYKTTPYKIAYMKQLKDNIIKHFPEYIGIHAIKNYKELRKPKYNFKTKIDEQLQIN